MPAIKKRKTSECLAEGCSFHAIGDGQKNLDENMMDHYLDIMRHLSDSSIKESHHLKFHRCSFCQKVFIKHKKNFNAHVSRCSANTPLAQGHILPQEDPFRRYQGPICMPVEEHISTNPRSSHAIASHAQMSTSGKMFSGTHEDGYPTVKSRLLQRQDVLWHLCPPVQKSRLMSPTHFIIATIYLHVPTHKTEHLNVRPKIVHNSTTFMRNPSL